MSKNKIQAVRVKLVGDPANTIYTSQSLSSPKEVMNVIGKRMESLDREHLYVLHLNSKCKLINISMCSIGSLNEALVMPREVYKAAILSNAAGIILAHNHPSGDSTPSETDVRVTDRFIQTGELMGIPLWDHVIVCNNGYYSMFENRHISKEPIIYKSEKSDLQFQVAEGVWL